MTSHFLTSDDPRPRRILLVDDDDAVRGLVKACLASEGYEIEECQDGVAALSLLTAERFDLAVCDVRMPMMDGICLLDELRRRGHRLAVIMLTACDDVPVAVTAMKLGASDFIVKPFMPSTLIASVRAALAEDPRRPALLSTPDVPAGLKELQSALDKRTGELVIALQQLDQASEHILEVLVAALDARERETKHHSNRVARNAVVLAHELGVDSGSMAMLRRGALLHDIGKIGIRDSILLKSGPLTAEEWIEMRRHPEIGSGILESVDSLKSAAAIVLAHHESYDGSGYPRGLKGDEIPFAARIFRVVDSLDAMMNDRPYRNGLSIDEAREEVRRFSGRLYDPAVVERFLKLPPEVWLES
jgi:putative nucleotidyltransferase with HDIG domain